MGTRFALTQESTIPDEIKQLYLRSSGDDAVITNRVTGTRCRGLENRLVKTVEGKGRGLALKESASSLLELRREFKVPLGKILLSGLRMKKAYEIPASQLGSAAAGSQRIKKALVEGDSEWGFMPCGQVSERIDDIPSCQELIERITREADEILEGLANRRDA
jgi:NAD(P)H-dependent flavin oxidoreductase YrpB (nitropropane dioxygenase family)